MLPTCPNYPQDVLKPLEIGLGLKKQIMNLGLENCVFFCNLSTMLPLFLISLQFSTMILVSTHSMEAFTLRMCG